MIVLAKGGGVDRAVAAANLWSRGTDTQARTNLRQTLASIRKAFSGSDIIDSKASALRVHDNAVRSDVDAFVCSDFNEILQHLETLGPLLDGLQLDEPGFSDWLTQERASLQRQVTTTLFELSEELMTRGELSDAQTVTQKLITLDEFDEGAHRQLMRIYVLQGAPAKALRHYDSLRDLLSKELDTMPGEATQQLMMSLRETDGVITRSKDGALAQRALSAGSKRNQKTPIVALPFVQYGADLDEGFGVSLAEDIAVELGRFATLSVLRQGDAAGTGHDDIVRHANAYIVEGSIRASGQRLRVSVQLVDGETSNLVWADRYETELLNSFDLLEEITRRAVATIPGRIQANVAERATLSSIDALNAHELMLRGKMLRDTLSADAMLEARGILQHAVSLDPSNARAQMYLSDTHIIDGWLGLGDEATAKLALHHAKLAISADHTDVFVQDHLGFAYLSNGMWQDGHAQIDRTLQKIKHEVESNAWCGYALALLGEHKAAMREVENATSRDQMPLAAFGWIRGQVFSLNGRFEDAIDELRGASSLNSLALSFLAGDYARLGRLEEAASTLGEFVEQRRAELNSRNLSPGGNTVGALAGGFKGMWRDASDWQHIASGLALAGLKDV
jgi:DNA-binding SARP family transcriptional activator